MLLLLSPELKVGTVTFVHRNFGAVRYSLLKVEYWSDLPQLVLALTVMVVAESILIHFFVLKVCFHLVLLLVLDWLL